MKLFILCVFFVLTTVVKAQVFYPLQYGDRWEYINEDGSSAGRISVVGDSTMPNSQIYTWLQDPDNPGTNQFIRSQGNRIYKANPGGYSESVLYDFGVSSGDTIRKTQSSNTVTVTRYMGVGSEQVFGTTRAVYSFQTVRTLYIPPHDQEISITDEHVADGIGLIYTLKDSTTPTYLQGAVISGTTYGVVTSIEKEGHLIPSQFRLDRNYPNPFNPTTTIRYQLPERSIVSLSVFNLLGHIVAQPLTGDPQEAGEYRYRFDASELPSGVYFIRLNAQSRGQTFSRSEKMVLLK